MRIAVLGTGAMGSRMAERLMDAGQHQVTVWNRTPQRAEPLVRAGATAAATPAQAAHGQDVVLSMLRDDGAARDAWLAPGTGALSAMSPGATAVDCSTVTPAWSRELAGRGADRSVAVLDAPLAGSRPQAEAGVLIFFVGGDAIALGRVRPVLDQLGSAVHHVGPAGAGAQVKLAVNALFAVQVATLAELLHALTGTDVDPALAAEVLATTPVASPAASAAATAIVNHAFAPAFPIELVTKDLAYALDDARSRQAPLPLVQAASTRYQLALDQGHGQDNITAVAQVRP